MKLVERAFTGLVGLISLIAVGIVRIVTSKQSVRLVHLIAEGGLRIVQTIIRSLERGLIYIIPRFANALALSSRSIASLLWRMTIYVFPVIGKIVKVGVIGGSRQFRAQFNRNGANMIRSVRKMLSPVEYVVLAVSVAVGALFSLMIGAAMLVVTFIVFFKDADSLALSTFAFDSFTDGLAGVSAALLVSLFKLVGAIVATVKWLKSMMI